MDEKTTQRNWKQRTLFGIKCEEVNASIFNLKWDWSFKDGRRQVWIYNDHKDPVAIWEEDAEQVKTLQNTYSFRKGQKILIGLTHHNDVVGINFGVKCLGWMDKDLFQATLFSGGK